MENVESEFNLRRLRIYAECSEACAHKLPQLMKEKVLLLDYPHYPKIVGPVANQVLIVYIVVVRTYMHQGNPLYMEQ
jgi:hypothetical protein